MAQQQAQAHHPIFDGIERGDLEAVQQRVLAEEAVLEERWGDDRRTPIMYAISCDNPAIALWLVEHRGQHDVSTADDDGWTALHWAAGFNGALDLVEALVAAGADAAALLATGTTPLILASGDGYTDITAFLLQQPAVKATIDAINQGQYTALSYASHRGYQPIVQLLLDAGADPTIPAGQRSPLNQALSENHNAIAVLLRHAIDEAERARALCRALHKARHLFGAGAAALACLQGRGEQGEALPLMELTPHQQQQHQQQQHQQQQHKQRLRATAAFAVGVSGGEKNTGLCEDLYLKLLGYMLPAWADKGPEA